MTEKNASGDQMKRIQSKTVLLAAGALGMAALSAGMMSDRGRETLQVPEGLDTRNGWLVEAHEGGARVFIPVDVGFDASAGADDLLALTVSPGWQADALEDGSLLVYEGAPGSALPGDESVPGSRVVRFSRDGSFTLAPAAGGHQLAAVADTH